MLKARFTRLAKREATNGAVARARGGMTELARNTGISREALYRALSEDGNPELGTALKVMHALGVKLSATLVA
jgi:probable addiction module antidote protein